MEVNGYFRRIKLNNLRVLFAGTVFFILIILSPSSYASSMLSTSELTQDTTKSGISMVGITCKNQLVVIIKAEDNSPACVREESAKKLVLLGWALAYNGNDNGIQMKRSFECVPEPNSNVTLSLHKMPGTSFWGNLLDETLISHTSTIDLTKDFQISSFKSSSYCGISYCYGQDYCKPNIQLKTKIVITTSIVKKTECNIEICNQARAFLDGTLTATSPSMRPNMPYHYLFYFVDASGEHSVPLTYVYQNSSSQVEITRAYAIVDKDSSGILGFEIMNNRNSNLTGLVLDLNNYRKTIQLCPNPLYTSACDGFFVIKPSSAGGGSVSIPIGIIEHGKGYNLSIISLFQDGVNVTSNRYIFTS